MTAETLLALAERAKTAEGPNAVLAAEIHCALRGYTIHEDTDPASGHFAFWEGEPWKSQCVNCSSWTDPTASVDEATTLVPSGWDHSAGSAGNGQGGFSFMERWADKLQVEVEAATPALALTAACLRARAASCDSGSRSKSRDALAARAVGRQSGGAEGDASSNPSSPSPAIASKAEGR